MEDGAPEMMKMRTGWSLCEGQKRNDNVRFARISVIPMTDRDHQNPPIYSVEEGGWH